MDKNKFNKFIKNNIDDDFWNNYIELVRQEMIPYQLKALNDEIENAPKSHCIENFKKAGKVIQQIAKGENVKVYPVDKWEYKESECNNNSFLGWCFQDSDVYKWIEAVAYSLSNTKDSKLENECDEIIDLISLAQMENGYLDTLYIINDRSKIFTNLKDRHELYCFGHLCEAGVAYYNSTGKNKLLNCAIKFADLICETFNECGIKGYPGHEIAELALIKLYKLTHNKKYLDTAEFFILQRGTKPYYFDKERGYRRENDSIDYTYNQAHIPPIEQSEAVGHAVRGVYLYSGMADVAKETENDKLLSACEKIWKDIEERKMYITGGIGARHAGEAFGDNYELPNLTAYNETCAAIGNVYMNYRLFLLHGDSKYFDVLERTLYNGLISGVSLDGGKFFYPNPLSCDGKYHFNADHTITRQPWFGCACCPSNISRFIPSLPGYVYAVKDNQVYVNLFLSNRAELKLNEKKVVLEQETGYPWNGDIRVKVAQGNLPFTMNIRIPGWVRGSVLPSDLYSYADDLKLGYRVLVNGEEVTGELRKGYLRIDRKWKKGDVVEVHFDMHPRVVKANEKVVADRGRVAVERGPIVYCAEWADNDFNIQNIILNRHPKFQVTEKPELLYGINEITTEVQALGFDAAGKLATRDVTLTLIPYYAWAHRGEGKMDVWLPVNRIDVE